MDAPGRHLASVEDDNSVKGQYAFFPLRPMEESFKNSLYVSKERGLRNFTGQSIVEIVCMFLHQQAQRMQCFDLEYKVETMGKFSKSFAIRLAAANRKLQKI